MKLKNEKIEYDEKSKSYIFDFSNAKRKKITSRMTPILLNKNNFNGVGYGVLDRMGMLEKEEIDPFFTVRGAVGENLIEKYLKQEYKKYGVEIETVTFNAKDVNYDNFKSNEIYGGLIDIGIKSPDEFRATVEVKSKNEKSYDHIVGKGEMPEEEVIQGEHLAYLSHTDKLIMAYIFFTDKQESLIKSYMGTKDFDLESYNLEEMVSGLNFKPEQFKIHLKRFEIDRNIVEGKLEQAYKTLTHLVKQGKMNEVNFRDSELAYLNSLLPKKQQEQIAIDDLPF
jgi:ATP-dependent Clp protease ATP-binding subunit ClpA